MAAQNLPRLVWMSKFPFCPKNPHLEPKSNYNIRHYQNPQYTAAVYSVSRTRS